MRFYTRKYKNLGIVLVPRMTVVTAGQRTISGISDKFPMGLKVEFDNGQYETKDENIIEMLKAHKGYGYTFFSQETAKPKAEMQAEIAAKKEFVDSLTNNCPYCGNQFANKKMLDIHIKDCPRKNETN